MTLLDTDHLTVLKYTASARGEALSARLEKSADREIGTTILSVEEQWRGWFAVIARHRDVRRQVKPYRELVELHAFLSGWSILPFDDAAADRPGSRCARALGESAGFPEGSRIARRELDGLTPCMLGSNG